MAAKAQRLYEAQELQNAFNMLLPAAQIKPEIIDWLDTDKYFTTVSELYPVLLKVSTSKANVKSIRDQRAQAEREAKATQEIGNLLEGAQIASETDPDKGLLPRLVGDVGL